MTILPSDDRRLWRSVARAWAVGIVATLFTFLMFWGPPARRGWGDVPSGTDTVPYTNMAVQLARGHGLVEDASDPLMSQWFTLPDTAIAGPVPSTRWPPLFPLMMSGVFWIAGYDLEAVRAANCLLMALACGLAAGLLSRRHGIVAATIFVVLFAVVDERARTSARSIMTEPLAAVLVTAAALLLVRISERLTILNVLAAGTLLGAAILTRTIVAFWMPGLVLLVIGFAKGQQLSWRRAVLAGGLMGSAALVVCLPWFVHNVRTLGAFMPLGSHVYTLPSGWSDGAFERGGVWASLGPQYFAAVSNPEDSPVVKARKDAEYGRTQAVNWISDHPVKATLLAGRKAMRFWAYPLSMAQVALLFPLAGLVLLRPRGEAIVIASILVLATLAVAATWIWEVDRMQAPTLALLHYAGAIGIGKTMALLFRRAPAAAASAH